MCGSYAEKKCYIFTMKASAKAYIFLHSWDSLTEYTQITNWSLIVQFQLSNYPNLKRIVQKKFSASQSVIMSDSKIDKQI